MKKVPYILITIIVLMGVLVPVSTTFTDNNYTSLTTNTANAISHLDRIGITDPFDDPVNDPTEFDPTNTTETGVEDNDKGWIADYLGFPDFNALMNGIAGAMMNTMLELFAWMLGVAALMLDFAVEKTVIEMGEAVEGIGVIDEGWATFRDVANIVLIFTLLAIGFGTILRIGGFGMRELLAKVIIVALLINFSLFFTKAIIDVGNLLAVQFYNKTQVCDLGGPKECTISKQYMEALSLTTLYKTDASGGLSLDSKIDAGDIVTIGVMGSILFIVTAFVFLAAAMLLIIRFVALIFLMVLSPLAFAGLILPFTAGYAKKWWSLLFSYTLFAPAFLLMTMFVLNVVTSPHFKNAIGLSDEAAFSSAIKNPAGDVNFLLIFLNFAIIIGFTIGSLIIARSLGIYGSEAAINIGNKARKFGQGVVGASTVGLAGSKLLKGYSNIEARIEKTRTGRTLRGAVSIASLGLLSDKSIRGALKTTGEAKFGGTTSFAELEKTKKARQKELSGTREDIRNKDAVANVAKGSGTQEDIARISSMNARQLEEVGAKKLANEKVAEHLSAEQLATIGKSEKFSEEESRRIVGARFTKVVSAANKGDKKPLRGLSDKEVELLGEQTLRNAQIIKSLSQAQIDAIRKSGKVNSATKGFIREERTKHLVEAIRLDTIEDELKEMTPSNIAKLDEKILIEPKVMGHLTPAVLIEIAKEQKVGTRRIIRDHIKTKGSTSTATKAEKESHDWMTEKDTPMGVIF